MTAANRIKSTRLGTLGRYRLLAAIGQGGMAEVFLAALEGPGKFAKLVAVKVLREELAEDPDGRAMFLNEARLAARLAHPNVVQTIEVSENGSQLYIVMEYLDGQSWSRIVQQRQNGKALPRPLAIRAFIEMLAGLHHAHELADYDGASLGLIHRDVSPQNMFVTYDGHVRVLDFGIAKAAGGSSETRTGVLKGKIGYLSPEQLGVEPIDRRVDVYAAGVMLWEYLAGRRAWKGVPDMVALTKVATEGLPPVRSVAAGVVPELERITMKAVALKREDRYATAADLAADLEAWLDGCGQPASTRALGRWVSEAFAELREETRRLVERQLARASELTTSTLDAVVGDPAMPELPQAGTQTGSKSVPVAVASSRGRSKTALLAACATVVCGAIALFAARVPHVTPAHAAGVQAEAPRIASPAKPTAPADAVIQLSTSPASAHIFLDGVRLEANPAVRRLLVGSKHSLRIEAEGYVTHTGELVVDGDRWLTIALDDAAVTPAPAQPTKKGATASKAAKAMPTAVAPLPPAPKAAPAPPTIAKSSKKTLDEENPFAH